MMALGDNLILCHPRSVCICSHGFPSLVEMALFISLSRARVSPEEQMGGGGEFHEVDV